MSKSYCDYLTKLAVMESGNNYGKVNSIGFLGKYQMGEEALIDAGYYKADGTKKVDFIGEWTGKDGVNSKADFLTNHQAQENAVRLFNDKNWGYIVRYGLDQYVGKIIGGVDITQSGLLGGAHLGGNANLKNFLKSNGKSIFEDNYHTPIDKYISQLGGYDTPYQVGVKPCKVASPSCNTNPKRNLQEQDFVGTCEDTGISWGDPHEVTYKGQTFDFQMPGEFVLTRGRESAAVKSAVDFEVQVRQGYAAGSTSVSLNKALANDNFATQKLELKCSRI